MGAGDPREGCGNSLLEVSEDSIDEDFAGTTTGYSAAFSIRDSG